MLKHGTSTRPTLALSKKNATPNSTHQKDLNV